MAQIIFSLLGDALSGVSTGITLYILYKISGFEISIKRN